MPRRGRSVVGGDAYRVLNRANGRLRLFKKPADFAAFEAVLAEVYERVPLRILGYTAMGNHWHFVVWPKRGQDDEVSEFFRRLTLTHSLRWHAHHGILGMGHVYQGRFKSFPIEQDEHLLAVLRYVERNPLRARLVRAYEKMGQAPRHQVDLPRNSIVPSEPVPFFQALQQNSWVNPAVEQGTVGFFQAWLGRSMRD